MSKSVGATRNFAALFHMAATHRPATRARDTPLGQCRDGWDSRHYPPSHGTVRKEYEGENMT